MSKIAQNWLDGRAIRRHLVPGTFESEEIRRALEAYVEPDCHREDPDRPGEPAPAREPLLDAAAQVLEHPGDQVWTIFLGAPGTGKTAFVLNYLLRHSRSRTRRKSSGMRIVSLSQPDADERIGEIPSPDRAETVLLLDGLDEDPRAINGVESRIAELAAAAEGFRAVGLTCSPAFLPAEIRMGEQAPRRLYLAPFTDEQIEAYVVKRFSYVQRREARRVAATIPEMAARPIVLAHVRDLARSPKTVRCLFQVYEAMVRTWADREKDLGADRKALREFAECVAVDVFCNRQSRGMERIPESGLRELASGLGISARKWRPGPGSLIDRDSKGNYKFTHRSTMEYLFAKRFADGKVPSHDEVWTTQIQAFFDEMWAYGSVGVAGCVAGILQNRVSRDRLRGANLRGATLGRADLSGTDLTDADLREADLAGTNLRGANLSGADLSGANLTSADLSSATLFDTDLSGADLSEAHLGRADASSAKLSGARLRGTDLHGAKLEGANLTGTDLTGADLSGAKASLANFSEADLREADLENADLSLANLSRVTLRDAGLSGADFNLADLTEANLISMSFAGANLRGATLRHAKLLGADLSGVDLGGAKMEGAHLGRANLSGANLSDAKLRGADLNDANLHETNLRDAAVTSSQVRAATGWRSARFDAEMADQLGLGVPQRWST